MIVSKTIKLKLGNQNYLITSIQQSRAYFFFLKNSFSNMHIGIGNRNNSTIILCFQTMTSTEFLKTGNRYTKSSSSRSPSTSLRRFKSFFGITPSMCTIVWNKLKDKAPIGSKPKHLLWCLFFLKQYPIEHIRQSVLGADEKTIRKWNWIFIKLLSQLDMVQ